MTLINVESLWKAVVAAVALCVLVTTTDAVSEYKSAFLSNAFSVKLIL